MRTELTDSILAVAPEVADLGLRLAFLCRAAGKTFSALEREGQLARSSVSAVAAGRLYPYPKLKRVVSQLLATALGEDLNDVRAYLFGDEGRAEVR
jgi:hypothetical protein